MGARLPLALESREAEAGAEDVPQAEMKALPDGKLDSAEEREGLSDADAQADGRPEGESDTVWELLSVGVAEPDAVPTEVHEVEGVAVTALSTRARQHLQHLRGVRKASKQRD